jgi:hypothetical protein
MDPDLDVVNHGVDVTHLAATDLGDKVVSLMVHVVQRGG